MQIDPKNLERIKTNLLALYKPNGAERVGFVQEENRIVEVANVHDEPTLGFQVSPADIIRFVEERKCWATWHTHPNEDCNLSGEDYRMFNAYKHMHHFIIGNDGIRHYKYDEEKQAIVVVD
jgi:proteasome lid subunit RPN8/RPN11